MGGAWAGLGALLEPPLASHVTEAQVAETHFLSCNGWQLSTGHRTIVKNQHSSPREVLRSAPHSYCSINHMAMIITTNSSSSVTTRPAWSGVCPELLPHILPWCPLRLLGSILAFFRFLHVIPYVLGMRLPCGCLKLSLVEQCLRMLWRPCSGIMHLLKTWRWWLIDTLGTGKLLLKEITSNEC